MRVSHPSLSMDSTGRSELLITAQMCTSSLERQTPFATGPGRGTVTASRINHIKASTKKVYPEGGEPKTLSYTNSKYFFTKNEFPAVKGFRRETGQWLAKQS